MANSFKPLSQKKAENTNRLDRQPKDLSAPEHKRILKAPTPAKDLHLSKIGKKYFKEICQILIEQHRLTTSEIYLIGTLAQWYGIHAQAAEEINTKGITELQTYPGGEKVVNNPALATMSKAADIIVKFAAQLGVTPFSQTRLNVGTTAETDPGEEYLKSQP